MTQSHFRADKRPKYVLKGTVQTTLKLHQALDTDHLSGKLVSVFHQLPDPHHL